MTKEQFNRCSGQYNLTIYGHINTAEQRTIIQQYSDWYTGRWWVGCYIWCSEEGPGQAAAQPSPLLAVPNVTAHPQTACVPTSYYSLWHYNCLCTSASRMRVMNHNWSATKQRLHLQSVAEISRHSVLSGDRI